MKGVDDVASHLRDHGIAVRQGSCLCIRPWRDAETGRDYVYAGIISTSSLVVQVDVATGRCRSFRMPPGCEGPWGIEFTLDGHLLVTSTRGQLCRIDPRSGRTWVTATPGHWLWAIERGADGKFYLGSCHECRMWRYDATTESLEDLGRLDPVQKYLRIILDGRDGYLYCSIGTTAGQMLAYHIATGRVKKLLPASEETPDFHHLSRFDDGNIYAVTTVGNVYRLTHGEAFPVPPARRFLQRGPGLWDVYKALPDGRPVVRLDPDAIKVGTGTAAKIIKLKYETDGSNIFHLAEGPGKTVYGSTIMPLYLLRYDPAKRKLENLGRGAPDNGEAYSFGHCDGKLYYACYSFGNLMMYDPAKPWHRDPPGAMKWKDNPRLLTNLGRGHNRPRAMCIDARKRLWIGSYPEYGQATGGLGCYDTVRRKYVNTPAVIPNQSIVALAPDPSGDVIYGSTTIEGGTGVDPVTKAANLFAWDTRRGKLLWTHALEPAVTGIINLLYHRGRLYGTTGSQFCFFRFNPETRKMDYSIPSEISAARPQSICLGPDGNFYGITWMSLFRWRPETGRIEVLYRCVGDDAKGYSGGSLFHRGAIVVGNRFYFSCGPHVMSLQLPLWSKA